MKRLNYSIKLLSILGILLLSCDAKEKEPKPNIILIMVDDMGFSDLGYFGSKINTPNIDRLAQNGITFSQFYNTGRCCPSRAALLTGLYQHQTGMGDMVNDMGHPNYQGYLNNKCLTIAEVLKEGGYQTLMSGKWHLGGEKEHWPNRRGFEQFYGIPEGGGVYYYPFHKKRNVVLNDSILQPDEQYYTTTEFNRYALSFVKDALEEDKPYFLYLPHIAPHFPLQAPKERYQKYLGKFMDGFQKIRAQRLHTMKTRQLLPENTQLSESDKQVLVWDQLSEEDKKLYDLQMAIYAAQLEMVDEGIGELLKLLEESGTLENTMILFLSDNGASHEAPHLRKSYARYDGDLGTVASYRAYERSWAHVSNTPFRMYKHWVHEGGISSPLIIHYPSLIQKPRRDHSVVHIMDIMPTLLELAEVSHPQKTNIFPMEGKSFLPLLKEQQDWNRDALFWEHEGNRAVREGDWKIVSVYPENTWRLYNIKEDRMEEDDLSSKHPKIKANLIEKYENWASRIGVIPRKKLLEARKNP